MKNKTLPYITGVLYALIFGSTIPIAKIALGELDSITLNAVRFSVSCLFFCILALFRIIKLKINKSNILKLLLLGLFQPVLYYLFNMWGLNLVTSSMSGILMGLGPVFVTLLSVLIFKAKVPKLQWLFVFISLTGIVVVNLGGLENINYLGVLYIVVSMIFNSFYAILSRKIMLTDLKPIDATFVMMTVGAIVFTALSLITSQMSFSAITTIIFQPKMILIILFLGIISNCVGFLLVNFTLSRLPPENNAVFTNLNILFTIILSVILLKEGMTLYYIIGIPLLLIGIWGTIKYQNKTP